MPMAWAHGLGTQCCLLQGKEVVFVETAMGLQSARSHTVVHAVPLLPDLFAKAPLYFKAEVDSASGEWSQHHAKRMIDTRDKVCCGAIAGCLVCEWGTCWPPAAGWTQCP